METRANYVLVGSFVVLFFLGSVAFVLWFAKFKFDRTFDVYDIYFSGGVSGLGTGSPVTYRGIRVGEVTGLRIDQSNIERIVVTIRVGSDTPVKENTLASAEMQGLAGGVNILLSGGTQDAPALEAKEGQEHAVIPSRQSRIAQILDTAPELVGKVDNLVQRASSLLDAENRKALAGTLANLEGFTKMLNGQTGNITAIIQDTTKTMASLRQTTASLDATLKKLDGEVAKLSKRADGTLASFDQAAKDGSRLVGDLRGMVAEVRPPLRDFSAGGLYELSATLSELRTLVASLNRVTSEVERSPARFFFGNKQEGYELR